MQILHYVQDDKPGEKLAKEQITADSEITKSNRRSFATLRLTRSEWAHDRRLVGNRGSKELEKLPRWPCWTSVIHLQAILANVHLWLDRPHLGTDCPPIRRNDRMPIPIRRKRAEEKPPEDASHQKNLARPS